LQNQSDIFFASSGDNGTGASGQPRHLMLLVCGTTPLSLLVPMGFKKRLLWSGLRGGVSVYENNHAFRATIQLQKVVALVIIPDVLTYNADPASGFP
jgi:hypothetical protein